MSDLDPFDLSTPGPGITPDELHLAALDRPAPFLSALGAAVTEGVLSSPGLGTALRTAMVPAGATPPARAIPGTAGLAGGEDALPEFRPPEPAMTEEEWRASDDYRKAIPWDPAMTPARAAALAELADARAVREQAIGDRWGASLLGGLAGGALDPVNYIPFLGPAARGVAVARFGRIAGAALVGAGDAALNTAVFSALTTPQRARFGDDVSLPSQAAGVAFAAVAGGVIGAAAGGIGSLRARRVAERLATVERLDASARAVADATDSLARTGDVDVTPHTAALTRRLIGDADRMHAEQAALGDGYDQVRADPSGPVDDPLVHLTPEDIEPLMVERGAYRGVNTEAAGRSKSGFGLVKVIWRHGEESSDPEPLRVSRQDVVDLPEIIRTFEPVPDANPAYRTWRVAKEDHVLVYGDKAMEDGRHLVTVYRAAPDPDLPLSPRKGETVTASSSEVLSPVGDTASETSFLVPEGAATVEFIPDRPAAGNGVAASPSEPSKPARDTASQPSLIVSEGAATAETMPRAAAAVQRAVVTGSPPPRPDIPKAPATEDLADQFGVDPATGAFREEDLLAQVMAEGRLTDADLAELAAADDLAADGNAWADALISAARCLI